MAPPDWNSAIEIHPPGWECPASPFWVAGWVTSAAGLTPVDVRAWLGAQPFLGLCGLPRPDKETEAHGRPGPPQAGFSFLLDPVSGAEELRIEVCDQAGRWTEIFRQAVTWRGATPSVRPSLPDPQPLLRLLQARAARAGEAWSDLAGEILAAKAAKTFDVMPSLPFQGALEQLGDLAAVQYDHLLLTGWVAHREQRIISLTAFLDTANPLPLVHGLPRPDAGMLFPDLIDGAHSRFAGYLRIPSALPHPLALRIFAELQDGRRELVFLKRFHPVLVSGSGTGLPPFSPFKFTCAAWTLRRAGWGTGWPDGQFATQLRAAWRDYRLAAPAQHLPKSLHIDSPPSNPRPLRVTLVTHNLNFEGAPLFLLEYARYLATRPGWSLRIVSPLDGPLRASFSDAGVKVCLVDVTALLAAPNDEGFNTALDRLAAAPGWEETDVIVANTMVSFWAVHLARRIRKPSLFYVHESVSARRFFALQYTPALVMQVEHAFTLATRVVFIAAAAQLAHAALAGRQNFRVLPGWIDAAQIRTYGATHSRAEIRRKLGYPLEAVIFANIGSLLPRKGQHVFLEAIRLLQQRPPPVSLAFWLVGARPGPDPYADLLRYTIATHPLPDVHLIEHSADPYQYFHAADIFVCSSLEEAFPRVVMEAAVFGRTIVSTNVNGIPEMLGPDEAWLVPPGDAGRLAEAMQAALDAHWQGDHGRARRARESVATRFDAAILLPQHADLVRAVAELPPADHDE